MASRRNLVSRARLNNDSTSSPAPRRQQTENQEPITLPPYETPSCQLSASGQRALDELRVNYDYSKYQKHINESKKLIPSVIGDANDRLRMRRDKIAKAAERRRRQEKGDEDKTDQDKEDETIEAGLTRRVESATEQAEKAMRDLIDYGDELAMQDTLLQDVASTIAAVPPPPERRPRGNRVRNDDSDDDAEEPEEEEDLEPQTDVEILSASELLQTARDEYTSGYTSKSMLLRQVKSMWCYYQVLIQHRYETNEYRAFKSAVHNALHPEDGAPPLPKATKWFPQDRTGSSNHADNSDEEDSEQSDDDVYIAGAKTDYKCPLTLLVFKEPYTNKVCKHTYEKQSIVKYIDDNGVQFTQSQAPGQRQQYKQIECVQIGCQNVSCDLDRIF